MDTPPLLYKIVHVTFVFWVPKTPPTPYMSGTFVLAPPPPPPPPPRSKRNGKETRLLTPNPSKNFLYVGSLIWNAVTDLI